MLLSSIIQALLYNQGVPYHLVDSANPENLAQTHASISLLKDSSGIVMAIYDNDQQFDLLTLKTLLDRSKLRFMSVEELYETLRLLKNTKTKPFNKTLLSTHTNNEIQLIIDEPMSTQSMILLVTDDPEKRVQVDIWDMQVLVENALIGGIFSHKNKPKYPLTGSMISPLNIVAIKKPTFG